MAQWTRCRFMLPGVVDYRPLSWPPPGPFWCSGYRIDGTEDAPLETPIVVAWLPPDMAATADAMGRWWPEAAEIEVLGQASEPTFTGRFLRPSWMGES